MKVRIRLPFIILVLSIISYGESKNPEIQIAVSELELNSMKSAFLPLLIQNLNSENHHYNDSIAKIVDIEFDLTDINVFIQPIDMDTVTLNLITDSNEIEVIIESISANATLHGEHESLLMHTSFDASIEAYDIYVTGRLELMVLDEGKPTIECPILNFTADKDQVDVHISNEKGLTAHLGGLIVNHFKGTFFNNAIYKLQESARKGANNTLTKVLAGFPSHVNVSNTISISYMLPSTPAVTDNVLLIGVAGDVYYDGVAINPSVEATSMPAYDTKNPSGIQMFVSQELVQTALTAMYEAKLMNFQLNSTSFLKPYTFYCNTTEVPLIFFDSSITGSATAECDAVFFEGIFGDWLKLHLSTNVFLDLEEYIEKAILYFKVETMKIKSLDLYIPFTDTEINADWLIWFFNLLLGGVKAGLTDFLGENGIPLPTVQNITYGNLKETVGNGYMTVYGTPKFYYNFDQSD